MVFKTRKIPKHLIIEDEFQYREKARRGVVGQLTFWGLLLVIIYIIGIALLKI